MSMFAFEHTEGITLISEYVKIILRNQLKSTVNSLCLEFIYICRDTIKQWNRGTTYLGLRNMN